MERVPDPAAAAFYIPLQNYPEVEIPSPEYIIPWVAQYLSKDEANLLFKWDKNSAVYSTRWLLLELPNTSPPCIQVMVIRSKGLTDDGQRIYGRRSARRRPTSQVLNIPARLQCCPVHLLAQATIHSRDLLLANSYLNEKKVVMVGVGTLGSTVTIQLARAGIGHLVLIDPDKLADANLGRHVLGADDLGRYKTLALKEYLQRECPLVKVQSIPNFIQFETASQPDILEDADAVVITTADWLSEEFLWSKKSCGASWSLIQGWAEPHAIVGHVLIAPTNHDIDGRSLFDHHGNFKHRFTEWPNNGVIPLPGCGASFIPGGPIGINAIGNMVSQSVIDALIAKISEKTWRSSIGEIDMVNQAGGNYQGPLLPTGHRHTVILNDWPTVEDVH